MVNRLDIVAVGVEKEGRVVAWMIVPLAGRAIVTAAGRKPGGVAPSDRVPVRGPEGEVGAPCEG